MSARARALVSRLAVAAALTMAVACAPALASETPTPDGGAESPDARAYELVTPLEYYGEEVSEPNAGKGYTSSLATDYPFQASANGEKVAYVASPTTGGNESAGYDAGNEYVAARSGEGEWTQTNIAGPSAPSAVYEGFSSDLSVGFLDSTEPLTANAPGAGETDTEFYSYAGTYDIPYTTNMAGSFTPLIATKPPYRRSEEFRTYNISRPAFDDKSGHRSYNGRVLAYAGASADSSHVLFEANDALTPEAQGGPESSFAEENNLYENVDGSLRLVNILPDGTTKANATFGSAQGEFSAYPDFSHVISADGSRIFWTDLNTGALYVRENGVKTTEISPSGTYGTATADGSKVFYTKGDLYEYDVETARTTDLTPGVAVAGLVGASEDGSYVYYVTSTFELEVWHAGVAKQIEALSAEDGHDVSPYEARGGGVWASGFANRLAEVTPDGRSLVYMVRGQTHEESRIEVYDADTGAIYCASCAPGDSRSILPLSASNTYQKRWISDDGSRVFFDSESPLVAQDTNGKQDVYEWQRPGSGECQAAGGCLYLLSGGTSPSESYLLDAGANGRDAFIVTRAHLLAKDEDEAFSVYDDRIGGFRPTAPAACTGSGCQGVPGAPPIFATPSSATFEGVGNFEAPVTKAVSKPKKAKAKKKSKKARPKKARGKRAKRGRGKASVNKAAKSTRSGGKRV